MERVIFKNPAFDDNLAKARGELNFNKRKKLIKMLKKLYGKSQVL